MTEAQDARDRKAKSIRSIGRVLAVIWAASWTLSLLAFALLSGFMLYLFLLWLTPYLQILIFQIPFKNGGKIVQYWFYLFWIQFLGVGTKG